MRGVAVEVAVAAAVAVAGDSEEVLAVDSAAA
jgi:hypothetical protein